MARTSHFGKQALKYLIFIFLSIISVSSFAAQYYFGNRSPNTVLYDTPQAACSAASSLYVFTPFSAVTQYNEVGSCRPPTGGGGSSIYVVQSACVADGTSVYSGSVTVSDWSSDAEYVSLTEQASAKFTGTYVCSNSCRFNYDFLSGDGDLENGPIVFKGRYTRTTTSCTSGDTSPNASLTGSGKPKSQCTKAYCDKEPNKSCPDNYSQGTFNGKAICVKNSPKNPNPNDPNNPYDPNNPPDNGGGDGTCNGTNNCNTNNYEFDVSQIVNAITAQTSAINNAIQSQTTSIINSISNAIGSITTALSNGFTSVTNALGITNTKIDETNSKLNTSNNHLNDIKNNTSATNNKLDSVDNKLTTANSHLNEIKNNTKTTNEKLDETNKKLDTSNEHLKKLEEQGQAASELLTSIDNGIAKVEEGITAASETLGDIKDFLTEDFSHNAGDSTIDIGNQPDVNIDTNINFNGYCPSPITVPINFAFVNTQMEFSYTRYCDLASFLKPVVIALASFIAALIIGGVRQED